jgi:hypothetical protein
VIVEDRLLQNPEMADLFADFPELLLEGVILQKEVLAHFGLLFSGYALLEAALQNCYVFWQLRLLHLGGKIASEDEWRAHYDTLEEKAFGSTFGSLLKLLSECPDLANSFGELRSLKKGRDYFAHHFFREENDKMFSDDAALTLIHRMSLLRARVKRSENAAGAVAHHIFKSMYPQVDMEQKLAETMSQMKAAAVANPSKTFGWESNQ